MKKNSNEIVFVYNADSGIVNSIIDYGHKVVRPDSYACSLCALTYGNLGKKKQWKTLIDSLDAIVSFVHRNEFKTRYESLPLEFPSVYLIDNENVNILVSRNEIDNCSNLQDLISLVQLSLKEKNE